MKYFITSTILVIVLFSIFANANTAQSVDSCSPKKTCEELLRDARKEITKLKTKLAEKPKVVTEVKNVVVMEKEEANKNIISGYVVKGPKDLDVAQSNSNTKVGLEVEFGVGLMYQRRFGNSYIGGAVDTNENSSVNLGVGF